MGTPRTMYDYFMSGFQPHMERKRISQQEWKARRIASIEELISDNPDMPAEEILALHDEMAALEDDKFLKKMIKEKGKRYIEYLDRIAQVEKVQRKGRPETTSPVAPLQQPPSMEIPRPAPVSVGGGVAQPGPAIKKAIPGAKPFAGTIYERESTSPMMGGGPPGAQGEAIRQETTQAIPPPTPPPSYPYPAGASRFEEMRARYSKTPMEQMTEAQDIADYAAGRGYQRTLQYFQNYADLGFNDVDAMNLAHEQAIAKGTPVQESTLTGNLRQRIDAVRILNDKTGKYSDEEKAQAQAAIDKLEQTSSGEEAFAQGLIADEQAKRRAAGKPELSQSELNKLRLKARNAWAAAGRDPTAQDLLNQTRQLNLELNRAKYEAVSPDTINRLAIMLVDNRIAPSQVKNAFGAAASNLAITKAYELDPNYNAQAAESNYQFGKSTQTQNRTRAIDNLIMPGGAFDQLEKYSNELSRTGSPWLNKPILSALNKVFGDEAVAAYERVATEVGIELAMALQTGGSQLSDTRVRIAMDLTDPALSVGAIKETLKASRSLLESRRDSITKGTYLEPKATKPAEEKFEAGPPSERERPPLDSFRR